MVIEAANELETDNDWIVKNLGQYLAPGKKRELICRWADNLEKLYDLGKYDEPLSSIAGFIRDYLRDAKLIHALPYVYDVLPPKYKTLTKPRVDEFSQDQENLISDSSTSEQDAKVLLAEDCKKGNANYIKRLKETIEILSMFQKDLETTIPLEVEIPEQELAEYFLRWDIQLKRCKEVRDGREKVLPSTQHLLHLAAAGTTLNNVYTQYVKYIRDFSVLTPKQTGKILKGRVSVVDILYEPKSMREAKFAGFYGTQCQHCEGFDSASWRVDYKYNSDKNNFGLFCYRCGKWDKAKTSRLKI